MLPQCDSLLLLFLIRFCGQVSKSNSMSRLNHLLLCAEAYQLFINPRAHTECIWNHECMVHVLTKHLVWLNHISEQAFKRLTEPPRTFPDFLQELSGSSNHQESQRSKKPLVYVIQSKLVSSTGLNCIPPFFIYKCILNEGNSNIGPFHPVILAEDGFHRFPMF